MDEIRKMKREIELLKADIRGYKYKIRVLELINAAWKKTYDRLMNGKEVSEMGKCCGGKKKGCRGGKGK